jgi:hypothetical protein
MVTGNQDQVTNGAPGGRSNTVQILGSKFWYQEQYLVGNNPGDVLLIADPLRVLIIWSVHSSDVALLSSIPKALTGQGIRLIDTMSPYEMSFATHGALVQGPWFAGGISTPFQITVFTMDYHEDW